MFDRVFHFSFIWEKLNTHLARHSNYNNYEEHLNDDDDDDDHIDGNDKTKINIIYEAHMMKVS